MEIPFVDISKDNWRHAEDAILAASSKDSPLLVRDLEGIARNDPMYKELGYLCRLGAVWTFAGSRDADGAADILTIGAEKVIVGSSLLRSLAEVDELLVDTENAMFMAEASDGAMADSLDDITIDRIAASMAGWSTAGMPAVIAWTESGEAPDGFSRLTSFPGLLYQRGGSPLGERARRILPFDEWKLVREVA